MFIMNHTKGLNDKIIKTKKNISNHDKSNIQEINSNDLKLIIEGQSYFNKMVLYFYFNLKHNNLMSLEFK